jgi:integrase
MWDEMGGAMKPTGSHPDRALTAVRVRNTTKPGRYADGNGLYLLVDQNGAKRWLLRTVVQGRRRDMGLGSVSLISLTEAREKAQEYRRAARQGGDPIEARRQAQAVAPTFEEAARRVHEAHAAGWKNPKHAAQWINTLQQYVFPHIGGKQVDKVTTADVLRALSPIWLTKPETARRVRQRVAAVLDWAKAAGFRTGDNPVEGVGKGLPRQNDKAQHHAALAYADVPAFVGRLREAEAGETVRAAFEFLILTAARTGEVIAAQWSEFDLAAKLWTVPAERMKAGREHRVPLSDRVVELIAVLRAQGVQSAYVFPGAKIDRPISNMAFLMLLRRMGETVTAHGFRSAFRDWSAERTNFSREVCEMALAHTVKDKVEAAYRRGDLLEKRRQLMAAWADHVVRPEGEVVAMRA